MAILSLERGIQLPPSESLIPESSDGWQAVPRVELASEPLPPYERTPFDPPHGDLAMYSEIAAAVERERTRAFAQQSAEVSVSGLHRFVERGREVAQQTVATASHLGAVASNTLVSLTPRYRH